MSGICSLFNLDASSVTDPELRAMTSMLEKRGPDRTGMWSDGPVGFGHTLLATTPCAAFEGQPYVHSGSGCTITADIRLDYREELANALGLGERCAEIGDAELVLRAWLTWGERCVERFFGDFAFAIWDPREQTLFCARDHFGMRPLYYHHDPGRHFIFASDARAILVLPQVPYRINEGRVADFIVPEHEWMDYTSTFYEGVSRLPPGHRLRVSSRGLKIDEYWTPSPGPEIPAMSDEDYQQGLLEVLSEAIQQRLRGPGGKIGAMLSGGMDSGSVTALANGMLIEQGTGPVRTYSAALEADADCDESRRIRAIVSHHSTRATLVSPDSVGDLDSAFATDIEEPFDGEFLFMKSLFHRAREQGQNTLLDGGGGDLVFNEGSYLVRLARSGHMGQSIQEIARMKDYWPERSMLRETERCLRNAFVPQAVKQPLRKYKRRYESWRYVNTSLISREFAQRIDIEQRCQRIQEMFPGKWNPDYASERVSLIRPNVSAGRERYSRVAASSSAETRDPFLDRRVVDYCSRLPGRMLHRNGWPKWILREAMAGKLPDEVRWGGGKPHIGWMYNRAFLKRQLATGQLSLEGLAQALEPYVDAKKLQQAWHRFLSTGDAELVHSAFILCLWLRQNVNRPVVIDKGFS